MKRGAGRLDDAAFVRPHSAASRTSGAPGCGSQLLMTDGDAVQPRGIAIRVGVGEDDGVGTGMELNGNNQELRRIPGAAVDVELDGSGAVDVDEDGARTILGVINLELIGTGLGHADVVEGDGVLRSCAVVADVGAAGAVGTTSNAGGAG